MPIPVTSNTFADVVRPRDDVNPGYKQNNTKYSLDWCQFIYGQYRRGSSVITQNDITAIETERRYAEGRQDTTKYRDWIVGVSEDRNGPNIPPAGSDLRDTLQELIDNAIGLAHINYDEVFSPLPKYVDNIIGIMQSQEHDIVVDAEDENSGTLREEMKYDAFIKTELQPILARFNAAMNIPDTEQLPVKPSSMQELELFENIGMFKLPYEVGMEKALAHTENISNFNTFIKDEIVRDLVVNGKASVAAFLDKSSGKIKYKHIPLEDLILEKSKEPDHSDSSWGGYIEYVTIVNLRVLTGMKEDDIYKIASNNVSQWGNSSTLNENPIDPINGIYSYDDFRIPVLHCFWKSVDAEYYTDRQSKNGPITVFEPWKGEGAGRPPKMHDSHNRKTTKTDLRRMYHARWIVDTDKVFDYGIAPNSAYNYGINDVEFPIRFYNLKGKSKIRSMIPIEDQIYLTFIKTQNAIAKAPPPGLAIEMGAIENITYNKKKLKPKDVITIRSTTGNIVYRLQPKGIPGQQGRNQTPWRPVEELKGGLGTAITDGIQSIEFFYRQLDVITGIDGISSANVTPSRDTGKAVSEMAIAATNNVLRPIYSGYIRLKEGVSRCAGWKIQAYLEAFDTIEQCPYYMALGKGNLLAIKTAGDFPPVAYGFRIEARANEQEKANILEVAKAALAGGKNGIPALTFSEYSFILRYLGTGRSVKYIELWIAKKEREAESLAAQRAEQAQKIQGEQNRLQEEAKRESELVKINAEKEKEIAVIQAKGEEERKTLNLKISLEERSKYITNN